MPLIRLTRTNRISSKSENKDEEEHVKAEDLVEAARLGHEERCMELLRLRTTLKGTSIKGNTIKTSRTVISVDQVVFTGYNCFIL